MDNQITASSPAPTTPDITEPLPPPTPPLPPASTKFPLVPLLVLLVIGSLLTTGYFAYQYFYLKQTQTSVPNASPVASSSASTIILADWLTYQSNQANLSFSYPPNYTLTENNPLPNETGYWQIQLISPLTQHSPKDTLINDQELKLEMYISPQKDNDTLEKFYNSETNVDGDPLGPYENTTINGIDVYRLTWEGLGSGISYYLLYGNKRLIITKYPQTTERDNEFNQILSTFKFVD